LKKKLFILSKSYELKEETRVADPDPDPDPYWIRISIRSMDPDPYSESGSGSRRAKMTHISRKKLRNFMF
jgi:hypothetical protein